MCGVLPYFTKKEVVKHAVLAQGAGHFWTVPVEMKFYILVPILFAILSKCNKRTRIFVLSCVATLIALVFPYVSYVENSIRIVWYLPVFIIGMITAELYEEKSVQINSRVAGVVVAAVICSIVVAVPGIRALIFSIPADGYLQNKYLYFAIAYMTVILLLRYLPRVTGLFETAKMLQFIGKISYSLYLVHCVVLHYVSLYIDNIWARFMLFSVISVVLATGLERFIERPFRKMGKFFLTKTKNLWSIKGIQYATVFLAVVFLVVTELYAYRTETIAQDTATATMDSISSWEEALYVPTQINKIGDTYFIVDCWNSRVLYNTSMDEDLSTWSTLVNDEYLGGHTIAGDGELYVLDNTDMSEVLVYKKTDLGFEKTQTIKGIEGRPYTVIYDENTGYFYCIGSQNATVYVFRNNDGSLELIREDYLKELADSYVRSISIIDGCLYAVSGPNAVVKYKVTDEGFSYKTSYAVPDEISGMNQVVYADGWYIVTINTDSSGDVAATDILIMEDLSELETGEYKSIYDEMGFVGQPYFVSQFDNQYYITQISEDYGNGIKSFSFANGKVSNITDVFYYEQVSDLNKERWTTQKNLYAGEEVDLIIFMGQSNMSGKGDATLAPEVEHGYEFRAITDPTTLYSIVEPFGLNENNPNGVNDILDDTEELKKLGGLVSAFANAYYESSGTAIVGVSCSEGNTTIDQWLPGGAFYTDAISRLSSAKKFLNSESEYRLDDTYMVWCQGESDGDLGVSFTYYYNELNSLTSSLVSDGCVNQCMIINIGEYADEIGRYDSVRQAQKQLCEDSDYCTLISEMFEDMALQGNMKDEYHYTQEAYNLVGTDAGSNAGLYDVMGENCVE